MRENKNLTISTGILTLVSLFTAIVLNYEIYITETTKVAIDADFITDVALIVFEGSFLTTIVSLIAYLTNKRRLLREQGDILIKLLNLVSRYEPYPNKSEDKIKENLKILDEIHVIVYGELASKRQEYCPFCKKSKQNKFLYSPLKYFYNFLESINNEKDTLKAIQKIGYDNKIAQECIEKINSQMYFVEEVRNEQGELSALKYDGKMYKKILSYIDEYFKLVNRKHKGKYHFIDQSTSKKV